MIQEGYDAFDDPYSYPGTTVLINRLDIRDAETLQRFELEISSLRAEEPLPKGAFDASHYCKVHHHLFQDVYEWAGQYRNVRTSKGGNAFCYPEYIPAQMAKLFTSMRSGETFAGLDRHTFAEKASQFLGELNAIHPFREGNGRSQLAFLGLIGATFGHPFEFGKLDSAPFLSAMIESYFGRLDPLTEELEKIVL